jgi:2-keto-4-pentenoate hydratase/2-oxohepta-3-ene-1,7-dioic acid hydratase in catechol pathway
VEEALSFLSSGTTIPAGTLCLMGTPSGVGWFCKPRKMLKDGDVFTVYHDGGIGTLENKMVFE